MYSFYDEVILRLGLSPEQTTLPRIVIYYNAGVWAEGHGGILDCTEKEIVFRIGKDKIKVCGEKLFVREISDKQLFVRGRVKSVRVNDEE